MSWGDPTHRQQPGELVSCLTFTDSFRADKIGENEEEHAKLYLRQAHAYATRQLEQATDTMRIYNLTQERVRLANIARRLQR